MTTNNKPIEFNDLPNMYVGDDVHATIERDTAGNPVLVLIAPLLLDPDDEE